MLHFSSALLLNSKWRYLLWSNKQQTIFYIAFLVQMSCTTCYHFQKKKRESNVPYFFSVVVFLVSLYWLLLTLLLKMTNLLYKQLQEIVCRVTNCLAVCSTPNATLLQMQHCIGPHKKVANKHLEWATYIPHFPAKKIAKLLSFFIKNVCQMKAPWLFQSMLAIPDSACSGMR